MSGNLSRHPKLKSLNKNGNLSRHARLMNPKLAEDQINLVNPQKAQKLGNTRYLCKLGYMGDEIGRLGEYCSLVTLNECCSLGTDSGDSQQWSLDQIGFPCGKAFLALLRKFYVYSNSKSWGKSFK